MYNLHLSAEQLEIRDMIRDFATQEIKPVAIKAERLDVNDRSLPMDLLDKVSQLGLRTLALSEEHGGAGADHLTTCIVMEELAAGDADIAGTMMETARLGHILFDQAMTSAQRDRLMSAYLEDDRYHLAFATHEPGADTRLGVNYRRPAAVESAVMTTATKSGNDWIIGGVKDCVANAPIAKLFAVEVHISGEPQPRILMVPADAPGLSIKANERPWHHGTCGDVTFKDCKVPTDNLLGEQAHKLLTGADENGHGNPLAAALSLGVGRAAYEAAVEYAQLRVQGGRALIEHQAIGTKLAEIAIKLEVSRAIIWQAAWASDHAEVYSDRSLSDLPTQTIAHVFATDMMVKATKDAAELFGAMGVMRDMPLQRYVHNTYVSMHQGNGNGDAKLRLAEALVGYRHPTSASVRAAE